MGIKDLYKVLYEECPGRITKARLTHLAGNSLAIDISIFLYKFIRSCGPEDWKKQFIILLCTLRRHGIKGICVFDGPDPPEEKKVEQKRRRNEAKKTIYRLETCRQLLNKVNDCIENNDVLEEELIKDIKSVISLRKGKVDITNYNIPMEVRMALNATIQKLDKQTLPIVPEYAIEAKKIIELFGIPQFQATGEAETLCAYLAVTKQVDAVLTEDTDVLAYGTPYMLAFKDFKISDEQVYIIDYKGILEDMELNEEEFRDLCILLSCDYNDRVKGYPPNAKKPIGIGAKKAVIMIQEYRRLEEVSKHLVDERPLKYRRCRELFTVPDELVDICVPDLKNIDYQEIEEYLRENKIYVDMSYIKKCHAPPEIIIEGEE